MPVKAGINASYLWVKFSPDYFQLEVSPDDIQGPKSPEWHVPYLTVTVNSFGPAMLCDGKPVSAIPMVFRGVWKVVNDKSHAGGKPRWVFTPTEPESPDAQVVTYDPKGSLLSPPLRLIDSKVRISIKFKDAYVEHKENKSFLDRVSGALGFVASVVTGCGPAFKSLSIFSSLRSNDRIGAAKSVVDFFDKQTQPANPNQKDVTLMQIDDIRWLPGDEQLPNGDVAPVPHHILIAPTAALKTANLTDGFTSLGPVKELMSSVGPAPVMMITFDPVETVLPNTTSTILNDLDAGDGLRKAFRGIREAALAKDPAKLRALRAAAQMEAEARVDTGKFLDREVDAVDDAFVIEVAARMGSATDAAVALGIPESTIMVAQKRSRPASDVAVVTQIAEVARSDKAVRAFGNADDSGLHEFGKPGGASWSTTKRALDIVDPPGPEQQLDREAAEVLYWLRAAGIEDPETEMRLRPYEARRYARDVAKEHGQEVSFATP
jgi:hypothetical protein